MVIIADSYKGVTLIIVFVVLASALLLTKRVYASPGIIYVNSLNDPGNGVCDATECTLREAIDKAVDGDIIKFVVDGVILLDPASGPLPLQKRILIDGEGRSITISGALGVGTGFEVVLWGGEAGIANLTLTDFSSAGVLITAGLDKIIIKNVTIQNSGNGIYIIRYSWSPSEFGVIINNCTVSSSTWDGIAVRANGSASVGILINNTKVIGNNIGIEVLHDDEYKKAGKRLIINNTFISGNRGQGIQLINATGVNITNTRIENNGAQGILIHANTTFINISDCYIYGNREQGILIITQSPSSYIRDVNITGCQILRSTYEGILITGSGVEEVNISRSFIGVDDSGNAGANNVGMIVRDSTRIYIVNNTLAYNMWHEVRVEGLSTQIFIDRNYLYADEVNNVSSGILITERASYVNITRNIVSNHRYDGIAVNGTGVTYINISHNKVGAFTSSGTYTGNNLDGNGAGIDVTNDLAPRNHIVFPIYGRPNPGPDQVIIQYNQVKGNCWHGILLIRSTNIAISNNEIEDNWGAGIYWSGTTGNATQNTISSNSQEGIRVEPYYGVSAHPDDYSDDVLSEPTDSTGIGLLDNTVQGNHGTGIYILDNPWATTATLYTSNTVLLNDGGQVVKAWLGYVKLQDNLGNPITGAVIHIFRGGSDGDANPDYVSGAWDANGRYGPAGFDYADLSTWWMIVEEETNSSGTFQYNDHFFSVNGVIVPATTYSWNGVLNPADSGGAYESPPGSGAYRYQFALIRIAQAQPWRREQLVGGAVLDSEGISAAARLGLLLRYAIIMFFIVLALAVTFNDRKRRRSGGSQS